MQLLEGDLVSRYRVESFISWHGDRRWRVLDHQSAIAAGPYRRFSFAIFMAQRLANEHDWKQSMT